MDWISRSERALRAPVLVVVALTVVLTVYTRSLLRANNESFENERRFQQMADNIQEVFWMINAETMEGEEDQSWLP